MTASSSSLPGIKSVPKTKTAQQSTDSRKVQGKAKQSSPFLWLLAAALVLVGVLYANDPRRSTSEVQSKLNDILQARSAGEPDMHRTGHAFRSVLKHFVAGEQGEGVGAVVRRSVGVPQMRRFTPFLMLDDFRVSPPSGFPDHPHHGQETITYVTGGMIAHEDFTGSKGVLRPGDLQFMTAGRAIVHSEIPVTMDDGAEGTGLQLWVDLPHELKNSEPRYRNLRREETPVAHPSEDLEVRVISGNSYGVESLKDLAYTPVHLYHYITKRAGTEWVQPVPSDFNVFMYVTKGKVAVDDGNGLEVELPKHAALFFNADGDAIRGRSITDDAEFAVIAGKILDQEVIQHGPFVETNQEKLREVFRSYQYGTNGFERAHDWRSSIASGISESEARKILAEEGL